MEAAPVIQRAIDGLRLSKDGGVKRLFEQLARYAGKEPRRIISKFEPQVVLLAWLLAAAEAGGRLRRDQNKGTQWNQQWLSASANAATLGGWISGYFGLGSIPAAGLNSVVFALFSYFDSVMDVSPKLGQASYGAAYKALMISSDLGYLIDNDLESEFLAHLADIVLYGESHTKFSRLPMPLPTTDTQANTWKREWCKFVNDEFRCWIRAMFRVKVSVPNSTEVDGLRHVRTKTCGTGTFQDLADWQEAVKERRQLLRGPSVGSSV